MRITTRADNGLDLDTLPRIGQSFQLPAQFSTLRWYGSGPWETYSDRKSAAMVGSYESTVHDQHIHYVNPCECGGHEDTRWLSLTDGEGRGIRVTGSGFHFSALPWTPEQYAAAKYEDELGASSGVTLTLDVIHTGLGGDTGWTRNIHPEYRIPCGKYLSEITLFWI